MVWYAMAWCVWCGMVCTHVCMYVCTHACVYECNYVSTYVYVFMYVCVHVCTHACMLLNPDRHATSPQLGRMVSDPNQTELTLSRTSMEPERGPSLRTVLETDTDEKTPRSS